MRVKTVPSEWLRRESKRLDSGPYTSGALETKVRLQTLAARKDRLKDLTTGHNGGLYNGPKFSRTWVDGPEHGVPFVGSGDMLKADLTSLPFLRRKDATSSRLSYLRLAPQMTLISCSGTIGRMVYSRPDMDGIWSSQHIMKVVPDSKKVPPGYLYAYLSSKFGVPLVVSGTYGSIIQSIEPQHIADLPVPRLGDAVEQRAHELVEEAAQLRGEANDLRKKAISCVEHHLNWTSLPLHTLVTEASSSRLQRRMDGFHHTHAVREAIKALKQSSQAVRLGEKVEEVFEPNRGARVKVTDPNFGIPFLSSSQVFRLDPTGEYLISKKRQPHLQRMLVSECDLLLPRSGQLGGIIGRAVLPVPTWVGDAASEHLVRVRCRNKEDAFYLWPILASEPGYFAAISTAFGSSIPSLDCDLLSELCVPWDEGEFRKQLVSWVSENIAKLDAAIRAEREAIALVERTIEEAS